jgi:peptide/nickel transport system substrate-binding protein
VFRSAEFGSDQRLTLVDCGDTFLPLSAASGRSSKMSSYGDRTISELLSGRLSRRSFLVGVAGTSLASFLASCNLGSSSNNTNSGPPVNTLNVGVPDLSLQLESIQFGEDISPMHTGLIYKGANGQVLPDLAESWTVSPDGKTWTFTLRQGVKAHDGSALTAHDVNTQFQRYIKVPTLGGGGNQSSMVQAVSKINIIDDLHIAITTSVPYATLLFDMPVPIPTAYYQQVGEANYVKAPIGFGPFKFVSSTVNQSMVFETFTDFWDKTRVVNFKTLKLVLLPEESTMLGAIQTGAIDVAYNLTSSSIQQLNGVPGIRIVRAKDASVGFLSWQELDPNYHGGSGRLQGIGPADPTHSPQRILEVRQALSISIDRATIASKLYPGVGSPATSPVLPTTVGRDPALTPYPFDPTKAKQLLASVNQTNLTIQLTSQAADPLIPNVQNLGQAIVSGWKDIGVNASFIPIDNATINDAFFANRLGGVSILSTTGPDNTDLGIYCDIHMDSTQGHPSNNDPAMTKLVHQLDSTIDPVVRLQVGKQVDDYIYQTYVGTPLLWFSGQIPIGKNVDSLTLRDGDLGPGPFFYMRAKNGSLT